MGKAKQRIIGRSKNFLYKYDMTRHQAIDFVVNEIVARPRSIKAKNIISLFGLHTEELTEAGVKFEHICNLENSFSMC